MYIFTDNKLILKKIKQNFRHSLIAKNRIEKYMVHFKFNDLSQAYNMFIMIPF